MKTLTRTLVGLACAGTALTACGTSPGTSTDSSAAAPSPGATTSTAATPVGGGETSVRAVAPRVLLSHDDGLTLIDAASGRVVTETAHPGFLRLSNAGSGRHVVVADGDTFRVYDAGIEVQQHGDHTHAFTYTPGLTAATYPAEHAGHAVPHHGRTTLFADGTGEIQTVESASIAAPAAKVERARTPAPHHGVAFTLADGSLIRTDGTEKQRSTVLVEKGGAERARTNDCPGVHGEATAAPTAGGDVAVFGCENGPVVYRDGAFHKVPVPDRYSRSGNLAGSPASPVVLGDYKVDADAELERPTRVALIDTRTDSLALVDLGASYWFRSLARGPKGEGVVLTDDGALKIIDPATKKVTRSVPAISAWQEKQDWQEPGPALRVAGYKAYVTDAAKKELVVVDLQGLAVEKRIPLGHTPVEMAVVTGRPESPAAEGTHAGADGHSH